MVIPTELGEMSVRSLDAIGEPGRLLLLDPDGAAIVEIDNPFEQYDGNFDLLRYEVLLFHRQNWPEAQLWTLREGDRDVGHIFSVAALAAGNSCIVNEKYARQGAAIAIKKLCLGQTCNKANIKECLTGSTLSIDELYQDDLVLAIISHDRVLGMGSVVTNWAQYVLDRIPVFSLNGLHFEPQVSNQRSFDRESTINQSAEDRNVTLRGINGYLPTTAREYFHEIVASVVPFQEHPAFRFFLCYQMLEILLEDIHARLISNFVAASANKSSPEMWKLLKLLTDRMRAADQIARLLNSNHCGHLSNQLAGACNRVLIAAQQEKEGDVASAVYALRNMIFHNFKSAKSYSDALIEASDSLFLFLCELSLSYQVPPAEF